jgi:hypothetical protein
VINRITVLFVAFPFIGQITLRRSVAGSTPSILKKDQKKIDGFILLYFRVL